MWSRKYNKCEKCGTTSIEHVAQGLCRKCYTNKIESVHKNYEKFKRGVSKVFLTKEKLIELYIDKQMSLSDIGRIAGCTRQTVYRFIKNYGIKLRNKTDARTIALERGKIKHSLLNIDNGQIKETTYNKIYFNKGLFSKWSDEMAYVLGLIYTDGNIYRRKGKRQEGFGILRFAQKEKELVEKILNLMCCNAEIRYMKQRKYISTTAGELYFFSITSNILYEQLTKLGLTPNKSLSMKFPEIPDEYIRYFIRGCWDGDGTVYIEKRSRTLKTAFVCGSFEFIEVLKKHLNKQGLTDVTLYRDRRSKKGNVSYYFRYGTNDSIKLFHYLYDGVSESQYLKRKYEVFKNYLDRNKTTQQLTLFN